MSHLRHTWLLPENCYPSPTSARLLKCPHQAQVTNHQLHWLLWLYGHVAELEGTGPRGVRGVKGKQKEWIRRHVLEKFVEEFNEQGTNVDLLLKVRLLIV